MPTSKHRINLTVPVEIDAALQKLARRDEVPIATKAVELLRRAIELDEDDVLGQIAAAREKKGGRTVPHSRAWK